MQTTKIIRKMLLYILLTAPVITGIRALVEPHSFTGVGVISLAMIMAAIALFVIHAKKQLVKVEDEAHNLVKQNNRFLSIITHDLKSPLYAIEMAVAIFSSKSNETDGKIAAILLRQIADMKKLLQDLDSFLSAQSGKLKLRCRKIMLKPFFDNLKEAFSPRLEKKKLKLIFDLAVDFCWCDPDRIAQVMNNLIGNAITHSPQGQTIVVRVKATDGKVYFTVEDHGSGIPKEQIGVLFEPYSKSTKNGSGLGLSIVKEMVELHGGRTWVESNVGEGSKFFFSLPLQIRHQ